MISAMPEQQIKELLSKSYLGVVASRAGFKKTEPVMDNGVDLTFTYPSSYRKKGFKRIVDSGQCLDFQLKATTENSIVRVEDGFQYDVKVNNYNDLIYRRDNSLIPLFLVIFILPYENYDWVNIDFDSLIMKKNAFWYYPDQNERIRIINQKQEYLFRI